MDERIITKTIRTQLSDHQLADVARQAAAKQTLITAMEAELGATTKARKADIAKIQAEFDALIKLAGDACTEEEMEVIERFDLARGVAIWIHPRTLEHLGERELTEQERGGPIGEFCAKAEAGETPAAEEQRRGLILLDETGQAAGETPTPSGETATEPELPPEEPAEKPRKTRSRKHTAETAAEWPDCLCGHPREHHDGAAGCLRNGCPCRSYRERDPLGLDGWVPPDELGDTNLAEEIDGGPGEVSDAE